MGEAMISRRNFLKFLGVGAGAAAAAPVVALDMAQAADQTALAVVDAQAGDVVATFHTFDDPHEREIVRASDGEYDIRSKFDVDADRAKWLQQMIHEEAAKVTLVNGGALPGFRR
jgi:hypothetical protein